MVDEDGDDSDEDDFTEAHLEILFGQGQTVDSIFSILDTDNSGYVGDALDLEFHRCLKYSKIGTLLLALDTTILTAIKVKHAVEWLNGYSAWLEINICRVQVIVMRRAHCQNQLFT